MFLNLGVFDVDLSLLESCSASHSSSNSSDEASNLCWIAVKGSVGRRAGGPFIFSSSRMDSCSLLQAYHLAAMMP